METLRLKWGSVKSWNLDEESPAFEALKRYFDEPVKMSAAMQKDTVTQTQAICDCIDALNGEIWNDWSGEKMTKEEAKKYVLEYGN